MKKLNNLLDNLKVLSANDKLASKIQNIYVDGNLVKDVVQYNAVEGWAAKIRYDADGRIVLVPGGGGDIEIDLVHGKISADVYVAKGVLQHIVL